MWENDEKIEAITSWKLPLNKISFKKEIKNISKKILNSTLLILENK